jgi:GrpB-like predicted nucleotidyltransferase (UPF0157 family)
MRYQVVPHNPEWKSRYASEADPIARALHGMAARLHHIGSTAIPGISAKPIIDILVEVDDLGGLDARRSAMEQLGYEVMGEFGIPGRRYFRKNDSSGARTHQVHAFQTGSIGAARHLAFRRKPTRTLSGFDSTLSRWGMLAGALQVGCKA